MEANATLEASATYGLPRYTRDGAYQRISLIIVRWNCHCEFAIAIGNLSCCAELPNYRGGKLIRNLFNIGLTVCICRLFGLKIFVLNLQYVIIAWSLGLDRSIAACNLYYSDINEPIPNLSNCLTISY